MRARSRKELLATSNKQRLQEFKLNSDQVLNLPALSSVPGIVSSGRSDIYRKQASNGEPHHINFITKNNNPHSFLWQTSAAKLNQAARWGIVSTQSVTGKVIASLGQYRIRAHERIMKGMISNSQGVKLKLLDFYQDRFSALQRIESLVNQDNNLTDYERIFAEYISKLQQIEDNLSSYFADVDCVGLTDQAFAALRADIKADKERALTYLQSVQSAADLRSYNRARGTYSILEFVKQQMITGLYELQGINQDMTYNRGRAFALTRGELNDYIEDARKEIEDYVSDSRNATMASHHGIYSSDFEELFTYDFSDQGFTRQREQQILMAISFIEGWDAYEYKDQKHYVSNGRGQEELDVYHATRWKTHRNVMASLRSAGYFILNCVKGLFVATQPWDEESWKNEKFHLNAVALRTWTKPIEPMWKKPIFFLIQLGYIALDIFKGIRDFGSRLVIKMPMDLVNDWQSTQSLPELDDVLAKTTQAINEFKKQEEVVLAEVLNLCGQIPLPEVTKTHSQLADVPYDLDAGEYNDLLNSMTRGIHNFSTVFTHTIYAKDPVGGLAFTMTYLAGIGMIYMPAYSASLFGNSLVHVFQGMSYSMASSPLGAAVAGGSSVAELAAIAFDGLAHGSSSIIADTLYQLGQDPLTVGAYCMAAYGVGYLLANGIAGQQIPWLSHFLQEDLGTNPSSGYPIIGAKGAVLIYEVLAQHAIKQHGQPHLNEPIHALPDTRIMQRLKLVYWLNEHAAMLAHLDETDKFAVMRQVQHLFTKEERHSLMKLFYPEEYKSIAFQIFAIPLSYVPSMLHVMVSPFVSLLAKIKGNPFPEEPMKCAVEALSDKLKYDFSRLIPIVTSSIYLCYTLAAAFCKMMAYLGVMAIGRINGLFHINIAHDAHQSFAKTHNTMRTIGEFFYPARAMKHVRIAHPTDTLLKVTGSYTQLCQKMDVKTALLERSSAESETAVEQHPCLLAQTRNDEVPIPVVLPQDGNGCTFK